MVTHCGRIRISITWIHGIIAANIHLNGGQWVLLCGNRMNEILAEHALREERNIFTLHAAGNPFSFDFQGLTNQF